MRFLLRPALAAGLLVLAAGAATAQQPPDLRPFARLLLDAPLLHPEKVEATFVRIDTASIHVVGELSSGDTLVLPLHMVRRAYLRSEGAAPPGAARRGTRRGALMGLAVGAAVAAGVLSLGEGDLEPGWWRAAVGIPLGSGAIGAWIGRQSASGPAWTRIDLLRYRPLQFPLDLPSARTDGASGGTSQTDLEPNRTR